MFTERFGGAENESVVEKFIRSLFCAFALRWVQERVRERDRERERKKEWADISVPVYAYD